ncbi:MAG: histidine kinase [Ferruginibacter sp.]
MIYRQLILSLTLCCLSYLYGHTQDLSYKHYGIRDGMVGNHVYHAVEDKTGFLWFATETGVSRFDGTTFKNFTVEEGLPDNEILRLFVDSKNRVWMIPFNNQVCYFSKGKIHNAANDSLLAKLRIHDNILHIFEDNNGNMFFAGSNSIIVQKKNDQVIYKDSVDGHYFFIYALGQDIKGNTLGFIAIDTISTKVHKIYIEADDIRIKPDESINISFKGNKVAHTIINKNYFFYTDRKSDFDFEKNLIIDFTDPLKKNDTITTPDRYNSISSFGDSVLSLNTGKGALMYDLRSGKYSRTYLSNENISTTLIDHENNYWFTSLENGIYRLYSEGTTNVKLSTESNPVNAINFIANFNNKIIAGNEVGDIFTIDQLFPEIKRTIIHQDSLYNRLRKITFYNNHYYFLRDRTIHRCDADFSNVVEVANNKLGLTYKDVEIDASGNFYLACHMMAIKMSQEGKLLEKLHQGRASAICIADGGVYIGTLDGLIFVNAQHQSIQLGKQFKVLKDRITQLLYDNGVLWIGTGNSGIVGFKNNNVVTHITNKEGLTGNLVRRLYVFKDILWVGTDRGISKIQKNKNVYAVIQQYTINDGLINNMINCMSFYKDILIIGTPVGLSILQEDLIQKNSSCKLQLLNIVSASSAVYPNDGDIVFKPGEKNIRFEFVAISYKAEGDIRYFYKLSGLDKDWSMTKENFLLYPSLPSGNYTLEIYAINKFGIKSDLLSLPFMIKERWYEKRWVIALMVMATIFFSWLIVNARVARIKKIQQAKTETAERMAMLEQQALKAQMNPHFIFNCLNSIQQFVIEKDVEGANRFITGFASLIRQTLDNSGKSYITVAEEESFLHSYLDLEKSRFEDKFDYQITVAEAIRKDQVSLPPLLLQPYVENYIRHGIMHKKEGKGQINIRFELMDDYLVCQVEDNGIGRQKAAAYKQHNRVNHESKGTSLTGQRINLMNKKRQSDILLDITDIFDNDGNIAGTKVTVRVPLLPLD